MHWPSSPSTLPLPLPLPGFASSTAPPHPAPARQLAGHLMPQGIKERGKERDTTGGAIQLRQQREHHPSQFFPELAGPQPHTQPSAVLSNAQMKASRE